MDLKTIKPKSEALRASLICMGLIGASTFMVYEKARISLIEEIKIGLISNVSAAATTINGDVHQQFSASTRREDSLYLSQVLPLEKIRTASRDIRYIYTNILKEGKVFFVLNPSPQNDNDGDGMPDQAPALMDEYKNPAPELLEALKMEKSVVSDVYEDEWGVFISSYAPFYDQDGSFVGTLGMDLELKNFYRRLNPLNTAFEKTIVIILFIGLVTALLIWHIRTNTQIVGRNNAKLRKHQEATDQLLKDENEESVWLLKMVRDEVGTLPDKIKLDKVLQYKESKCGRQLEPRGPVAIDEVLKVVEETSEKMQLSVALERGWWPGTLRLFGAPVDLYHSLLEYLIRLLSEYTDAHSIKLRVDLVNEQIKESYFQVKVLANANSDVCTLFHNRVHSLLPLPEDLRLRTLLNTIEAYGVKVNADQKPGQVGFCVDLCFAKKAGPVLKRSTTI